MRVGIVGATGAVGRQMIECLEERKIEIEELRLFASPRSKGKKMQFQDKEIEIDVVNEGCFDGLDYVLGAVSNALSKEYAPLVTKAKAIYIDNSSAFRMDEDVPLVVPEINGESALKNKGIIANPNCSTIITLMALAPIAKLAKIESIIASTYQAVSGAGIEGMQELSKQIQAIGKGEEVETKVFPAQIAYNAIPQIGSFVEEEYTSEEMKMQYEGRKILGLKDLKVSCTCVRVPVYRSHSISARVVTDKVLDIETVKNEMKNFEGLVYTEEVLTPMMTSNQDLVYVSRLRRDLTEEKGLVLWCCGDQIRKGAASNAVSIMEYIHKYL